MERDNLISKIMFDDRFQEKRIVDGNNEWD